MTTLYDPPSGWRFGFPKVYLPLEGETLADTLLRDGYPQHEIDNGGAKYCRFIGGDDASAQQHVEGVISPARQAYNDNWLTPAQEAAIVEDINSGRFPYLLPVAAPPVYISTYTGRFHPFDPKPEEVRIEDIAHGLAMICRYTGAGRKRYSVAEHSILMARWLHMRGYGTTTCLAALLHDAPEALSGFGDVARPVKDRAPVIKATEEGIWNRAIVPAFRLDGALMDVVHDVDARIIRDEMEQNHHEVDPRFTKTLGVRLVYWTPEVAVREFLEEFGVLMAERDAEREVAG